MAKYGFKKANLADYDIGKYVDVVFFAEDKGIIMVNGKRYGNDLTDEGSSVIKDVIYSAGIFTITYTDGRKEVYQPTKEDIGLGNVTNDAQVRRDEMGAPLGVPTLDENGVILPKFLKGVLMPVVDVEAFVPTKQDLIDMLPIPSDGSVYYAEEEHRLYVKIGDAAGSWSEGELPKENTLYVRKEINEHGHANETYRWSGSVMVVVSESLVLGVVDGTAYEGSKGKELRDEFDIFRSWYEGE